MIEPNSPAYPVQPMNSVGPVADTFMGLTIRQRYAMAAMQGMMSVPADELLRLSGNGKEFDTVGEWIAENSFSMADAMIAFENKEKK